MVRRIKKNKSHYSSRNGWYPVEWYCSRLNEVIVVSSDSIPNPNLGFMCDCCDNIVIDKSGNKFGVPHWVLGNTKTHMVIKWKLFMLVKHK